MSQDFFRFKQFTVHQSQCAMKVCTDACFFGAWLAAHAEGNSVLDIGTGTGLLSLMYLQKHPNSSVQALEIDTKAAAQAKENIQDSPWSGNISVENTAMQQWQGSRKFELIFSNPPFFEKDLHSPDHRRNAAMHDTALRLEEIVAFAKTNLQNNGRLALLIPFHRTAYLENILRENQFLPTHKCVIKQTLKHAPFRSIIMAGIQQNTSSIDKEEIAIKDENNNYTTAFQNYLKDYYLFL